MTTPISRRSVARGAAWSIPAIAVAGAAPAMAASNCGAPTPRVMGGVIYDWGTVGVATTNQSLNVGAQTYVDNLPAGVTVTKVTYDYWFQLRNGQTSSGPGIFWVGNTTSNRKSSCGTSTCSNMTYSYGSAGWQPVTSTSRNTTITHTSGPLASWNLHFEWRAGSGAGSYTAVAGTTCQNFTTGPSGRFITTYTGVPALSTCGTAEGGLSYVQNIVITLSNGQTLTYQVNSTDASNVCK